jgi:HK97 family phage major capsid protein/HK97 family phage prohead protease
MPLPKPHSGETEQEFIDSCMSDLKGEYPDSDQRFAVCMSKWEDKENGAVTVNRAYAILHVKAVKQDSRHITGVATTPTPDRVGDIVEPGGIEFKNPMPLLWQHDSSKPVGHVWFGKANKNGIPFEAQIATIDEPGVLKDRLDEAWQSVKLKLVNGVSIGFRVLDNAIETLKGGGIRYLKSEVMEMSLVTIPANQEATILTIKALDESYLLAASGHKRKGVVRIEANSPGVTGSTATNAKGINMKTIKEQIAAFEATRAAKSAQMVALMEGAGEKGETLDAAQAETYDALDAEVKTIDAHLTRLTALEKANITAAKPAIQPGDTTGAAARIASGPITVTPNVEKGVRMARYAMSLIQGKGNLHSAQEIFQANKRWMDQTPEVLQVLKTAVLAGDSTTTGWASELVYAQDLQADFIEFLRPQTILGKIGGFRRVPFNVRVGSQTGGSTAYWVGQGRPVPVSKLTTSSATLGITKMAGLIAIDDELARSSSPSAELLVRNDLAAQIAQFSDTSFIDPTQGGLTNIQPASVTYGATAVTPSGTNFAAIATDVKAVFAPMITAEIDISQCYWVMTATTALALSLMQTSLGNPQFPTLNINGGTWQGLPVIVSQAALMTGSPDYANMIVLIAPQEIMLADEGGVSISVSNEASIEMLDNPTNRSAGSSVATSMVSMFQTNTLAIKAVRYINWTLRRTAAAQYIRTAAYA